MKKRKNIFNIANYILKNKGYMSTMKLQKLCFYSQAYNLVNNKSPLFDEDFQAWINGPVCKELYDVHKSQFVVNDKIFYNINCDKLTESDKTVVDTVLNTLGDYTGNQLSELTHAEDPWKKTRGSLNPYEKSEEIIKKSLILNYYSSGKLDNPLFN